jgi:hypothetical protein
VKWPADSFVAQKLALPLEWLGFETDYFRVLEASDLPKLGRDYRAIVVPRLWQIPVHVEPAVVDWLVAERAAGRKILFFGGLPFRDPDQRLRLIRAFGLDGTGAVVAPPLAVEIVRRDAALFGFESEVPALPTGHLDLRAPAGARTLLSVRGRAPNAAPVDFDPVFVCDWGGFAFDPYVTLRRPDFRELWHLDPFAFLTLVLGEVAAPSPDTTTRDGLRMFMSHIDGDGFSNFSRVEAGKRSAEIVRDRLLKKYPFPVTVSIIEAELRGLIRTQRAEDSPALEAIARDIYALPHIEAASHTFSHPFFWITGDRTEGFYDEQNLDLKTDYPVLDLAREIDGSVGYINERLAAPGRPVRVFLWSGNCRPPPAALARVRALGLENVNGGDTIISPRHRTVTAVAPRTMPWDDELQIYAPNQNENVYTNNWRGPLFGTFVNVIDTFELTERPRRFKPVNVYYHFYGGDYPASLQALETILDWCAAQPLHSVALSHYARMARDARTATVYAAGPGRWTIVTRGDVRTFRVAAALAPRIDLARSTGVTGWNLAGDQAYVHTDGTPVISLVTGDTPFAGPRLESSTAEIAFQRRGPGGTAFTVRDLRPVTVVFAGLAPGAAVRAAVDGAARTFAADAAGRVTLALPPVAAVELEFPAP